MSGHSMAANRPRAFKVKVIESAIGSSVEKAQ